MKRLREFIETRGADAAANPEFLPYYALPYVPAPTKHPTFSSLFLPKWTLDMRGMLERFIANAPSETPPPRIHAILLHYYGLDNTGAPPSPPKPPPRRAYGTEGLSSGGSRARSSSGDVLSSSDDVSSLPLKKSHFPSYQQHAPTPMVSAGFTGPLPTALSHGPRGITPLLEGVIDLDAFYPTPDYSDLGAEVLTIESLVKQVAALAEPPGTPSDSPREKTTDIKKTDTQTMDDENERTAIETAATEKRERKRVARLSAEKSHSNSRGNSRPTSSGASSEGSVRVRRPLEGKYLVSPQSSGRVEAKYPEDLSLVRLDYREVVLEFRGGVERLLMSEGKLGSEELDAESQVARLLQALRWRISRSPDASVLIVEAVRTMIRGDVLCIRSKQISERTSGSLVDALLLGCLGAVRAQTLRLINSLAQTGDGRKYLLLPGSRVVAALAAAVEPDEHDTRARRHLLGALQKLSFHSVAARRMCALGVMGWVTKTLRGAVTTGELKSRNAALRKTHEGEGVDSRLSEYDAEHGAALLMNLSLVAQGKVLAARMATIATEDPDDEDEESILEVIKLLLQSPSESVRVYANATLYSLLQHESFRAVCLKCGFEQLLEELRDHSDPTFYRQLSHLLGALRGTNGSAKIDAPEDDPNSPFVGYHETTNERFDDVQTFESALTGGLDEEDEEDEEEHDDLRAEGRVNFGFGVIAPVAEAGATRRGASLRGEPLLREEYAAEEGEGSESDSPPGGSPAVDENERSPFAGGNPFAQGRFAPVPEEEDADVTQTEPEVAPKRLYRDPDDTTEGSLEPAPDANTPVLQDPPIDAARFSGVSESEGEPEFEKENAEDVRNNDDDVESDAESRFTVDPETSLRSGGFGLETLGPDELAEMTSRDVDDEAAPVTSSGDVDDEAAPVTSSGEIETEARAVASSDEVDDEPAQVMSSGEVDDEAPATSADIDDEAPEASSGEIDDDSAPVMSSGEVDDDDDTPAVSEEISDEVAAALSSEIEDHVTAAAAASELTDADAAGDESDGFDEFDDGSDFPVMTAHSEPEPVDPLLSPDAETAGSDSPRL